MERTSLRYQRDVEMELKKERKNFCLRSRCFCVDFGGRPARRIFPPHILIILALVGRGSELLFGLFAKNTFGQEKDWIGS